MNTLKSQFGWFTRLQYAVWIVTLLLAGAVYALLIRPALLERGQIASATATQRQAIATALQQTVQLTSLEREVADLQNRFENLDKKLPKKPDMDQFMREINRVSEQTALKKVNVQLGSPRRSDKFSEMPIGLTFTGDFNSIITFLKETEDMQRLSRVRSLAIKSPPNRSGGVEVDLALSLFFADE